MVMVNRPQTQAIVRKVRLDNQSPSQCMCSSDICSAHRVLHGVLVDNTPARPSLDNTSHDPVFRPRAEKPKPRGHRKRGIPVNLHELTCGWLFSYCFRVVPLPSPWKAGPEIRMHRCRRGRSIAPFHRERCMHGTNTGCRSARGRKGLSGRGVLLRI